MAFESASNYFYHGSIRRYSALFGSLFANIYIKRTSDDNTLSDIFKVPLRYATGNRYAAVGQTEALREAPLQAQILPAMSFELNHFYTDPERQTNRYNKLYSSVNTTDETIDYQLNRVPYNFEFEWSIRTKNIDDMLQIVEQTIPRFNTPLTINMNDSDGVTVDQQISITFDGPTQMSDNWEDYQNVRHIDWVFSFTLKGYLYQRTNAGESLITEVDLLKQVGTDAINAWFEVTPSGVHVDLND